MKVVVWLAWPEKCFRTDAADIDHLRSLLPRKAEVVSVRSERKFLSELADATHVLTWQFKREWFARAPKLALVATPAAGREFVSPDAPAGVSVHFGHFHGAFMSETVAALVLAWARGIFAMRRFPENQWPRTELSGICHQVSGTRAVVVGYGNVGRAIGEKLTALGVSVVGVTRHGLVGDKTETSKPLSKIMNDADWLVLALPGDTGTDGWLDAARLRQLPRRAVVINVGRGNAVDERALFGALKAKRIAGACLDVRRHEPTATVLEEPDYVPELASLPNCITLPHASAFSSGYMRRFFDELKADGCL